MSAKRKRLFQATIIAIGAAALTVIIVMAMVASPLFNQQPNPPAPDVSKNQTTATNNSNGASITPSNSNGSVENNSSTVETSSLASAGLEERQVNTLSLTSAFPFVQRWVAQYNNEQNAGNVKISYFDSVADSKISDLLSGENASVDLAIINNLSNVTDNVSYLPVSPHALAIVYNIPSFPDVPSGLKLDARLLSGIFNGTITYWNDQGIVKLNPSLNLPKEKIIIIRESEIGDTKNVTSLLARYIQQFLPGSQVQWSERSITTLGPDDLSAMVRQTPYSIGYVDFSYAVQTKMTFAALQNIDGQYIVPSTDSIDRAVQNGVDFQNATNYANNTIIRQSSPMPKPPTISIGKLGNRSYPVVGFYYAAFARDNNNTAADKVKLPAGNNSSTDQDISRNATLDFIRWTIGDEGQRILSEVQYPSIYNDNDGLLMQSYAKDIIDHL